MVIKRWLHLQPLCLCSKKERQRVIWAQKACQPVLSPDPVTWPRPAWGNWGSKYWCRAYHHSKQQRGSVSEEEGEYACWTDNSGSGSTLQREAASRQLSRRSSRFLQMQVRAVTLLVTSLGTTNPGIKLTGDLHIVCRLYYMQDQVVCCVRYKGLTKETTLQFSSESMGMNSEDTSSSASSALCYPFSLGKSSTLKFFMWKW